MKLAIMSAVLGVLLVTTAAHADLRRGKYRGVATLAAPVAKKTEIAIKGLVWQCEGDQCVVEAQRWPGSDKFTKQCRIVAAGLGDLTSFHSSGRNATKDELSRCNSAARAGQTQNAG